MPARVNKIRHDENTRLKIQAAKLINGLQAHFDGERELSATQINAAKILLDRSLPVLQSVEHSGEVSTSYVARIPEVIKKLDDWTKVQPLAH